MLRLQPDIAQMVAQAKKSKLKEREILLTLSTVKKWVADAKHLGLRATEIVKAIENDFKVE